MKVQNFGEEFVVTYGGHEIIVPSSLSQDFPDAIGYHIQFMASKWGKNVQLVYTKQQEIDVLNKQFEEAKKEVELSKEDSSASTSHTPSTEEGFQQLIQEEIKEEVVEPKKPGRPKKV
jgi:hypothetical protein